jgi:hypothetical protein
MLGLFAGLRIGSFGSESLVLLIDLSVFKGNRFTRVDPELNQTFRPLDHVFAQYFIISFVVKCMSLSHILQILSNNI